MKSLYLVRSIMHYGTDVLEVSSGLNVAPFLIELGLGPNIVRQFSSPYC